MEVFFLGLFFFGGRGGVCLGFFYFNMARNFQKIGFGKTIKLNTCSGTFQEKRLNGTG